MVREQAGKARLDEISTEWSIVHDPAQFIRHYAAPIERYVFALVKNRYDAEDIIQDFYARIAEHGFVHARQERGRFRHYLKAAIRNAVRDYLRRSRAHRKVWGPWERSSALEPSCPSADSEWLTEWRRCILQRALDALERHQSRSPGNLFRTVLALLAENPLDDSQNLAARAEALAGRRLRVEAFRKQVSRARALLAKLLVKEISETLDNPSAEQIYQELADLGLFEYVRRFLPASSFNST